MMLALLTATVGLACPPGPGSESPLPAVPANVVATDPVIRTVRLDEPGEPAAEAKPAAGVKVTDCTPPNPLLPESIASVKISLDASATFEQFFDLVSQKLPDTPMDVDWKTLEGIKVTKTTQIGVKVADMAMGDAFKTINQKLDAPMDDFACAVTHGVLSVTTMNVLDRDKLLKIYDIRDVVTAEMKAQERTPEEALTAVTSAITQAVHPEDWADMGGEKARWQHLNGSLIITAPARFHRQIECLLDAMRKAPEGKPA